MNERTLIIIKVMNDSSLSERTSKDELL